MIRILKPNDFHHHLRDKNLLELTTKTCFDKFNYVIAMPNLIPPIITIDKALEYRDNILEYDSRGNPLMTLYLHKNISISDLRRFKSLPQMIGIKYYPQNATTNSNFGVDSIESVSHILKTMEEENIPLLIHGESILQNIDIFDREKMFVSDELSRIRELFPNLKIVLEHITTKEAVDYVIRENIHATITPHHLLLDRNDIFRNGINPHHYCLPILKRNEDKEALIAAAISGKSNFFLGTDSAPHEEHKKLSSCGCAGIFNSPVAVELVTELFEKNNSLEQLEKFVSTNGCDFYGLPYSNEYIYLKKESWFVPSKYNNIVPLYADKTISWKYSSESTIFSG